MQAHQLTLLEAKKLLEKKQISLEEIYHDIFQQIERLNKRLNVYLTIDKEALKKAASKTNTLLKGLPIAIKDNFLTMGMPTTAASLVLENYLPQYESTVTKKILAAGGIIIGKTNMDAWAHGSSTETSQFGATANPRNPKYLPGGSSGGSAAAVAADMCLAAIGSETAGSIRQPAAWVGCVGLKPTYGRVSRYGVVAMGSSLDSPGPLTKTVSDAALVYSIIAGKDEFDATTGDKPQPNFNKLIDSDIKGLRVGICYMDHPKIRGTQVDLAVRQAGKVLENLGAKIDQVPLSDQLRDDTILNPDYSIGLYTVIQRSEVSSNLARYDGIRYGKDRSFFGAEAKRRVMLGTFTLSKGYADKYYLHAQKVRSLYLENFAQLFSKYDVLISSPSPGFAQKHGATADNPMFGELEDMLNEASSIAGLPGISVPCYRDPKTNLFIGLNIMAKQWDEATIIRTALAYEKATKWNTWLNKTK